jgi:hypothetical protein
MTPEQKHFAYKIATSLNDLHSLALHESYVRQYPREVLEDALQTVLSKLYIDNKGAYYNKIVQQYARKFNRN